MRIIAVSNNKGGVGKTTSTVNIAAALQMKGKRVCVIDLDHQAQATYHLGYNPKQIKKSIFHVLKGELPYDEIIIKRNELHLLPANQELKDIEFLPIPAKEFLLRDALEEVNTYDFILIDCPPSLGVLTLNALAYSKEILVPLQVQFLPFHGMYNLFEAVQMVKRRLNKHIDVTGIIGTMYNAKRAINRE